MKKQIAQHFRLSLLVLVVFSFGVNSQARRDAGPANVVTQTLKFESLETNVEAVGTAEALKSVNIFPAAADKVTGIFFEPGNWVEKGQTLMELDARRQKAALERSKILLQDAILALTRLEQSSDRGAVAQSAIDDAKTAKSLAQVAVTDAQTDLDDRILVAPFSGYVGLTDVEVGDRITTQTMITTLDDRSLLFINFSAPEASIAVVNQNTRVSVQPWTNRDLTLQASVAQVDSRLNVQDRTIRVRAQLQNADDIYRPGMSFRVSLVMAGADYAAIPESGLSWGANGAYVWKVENNQAVKVAVQIKQRLRGRILVDGDLIAGDTLIVEGIQRLRPGQKVAAMGQEGGAS